MRKCLVESEHIIVYDVQQIKFDDELKEAFLEKEWNHVEVSYREPSWCNPEADIKFPVMVVKECGVYVFKKRTSMEDIRFTNPYMDREGNQICGHALSEAAVPGLDSPMSSRLSDTGSNGGMPSCYIHFSVCNH